LATTRDCPRRCEAGSGKTRNKSPAYPFRETDASGNLIQEHAVHGWCTRKPEIYLVLDQSQSARELLNTLCHELVHADDFASGLIDIDLDTSERKARLFGMVETEGLPDDARELLVELEHRQRMNEERKAARERVEQEAQRRARRFLDEYLAQPGRF
jgi:hypothetical protein